MLKMHENFHADEFYTHNVEGINMNKFLLFIALSAPLNGAWPALRSAERVIGSKRPANKDLERIKRETREIDRKIRAEHYDDDPRKRSPTPTPKQRSCIARELGSVRGDLYVPAFEVINLRPAQDIDTINMTCWQRFIGYFSCTAPRKPPQVYPAPLERQAQSRYITQVEEELR